jgi:hypothetical protein
MPQTINTAVAGPIDLTNNGYVLVEGDVNGDCKPDFQIELDDVMTLVRDDFIPEGRPPSVTAIEGLHRIASGHSRMLIGSIDLITIFRGTDIAAILAKTGGFSEQISAPIEAEARAACRAAQDRHDVPATRPV